MARKLGAASAAQKIISAVADGTYSSAAAAVEANPNWEAGLEVVAKAATNTSAPAASSTPPAPKPRGSGYARYSR